MNNNLNHQNQTTTEDIGFKLQPTLSPEDKKAAYVFWKIFFWGLLQRNHEDLWWFLSEELPFKDLSSNELRNIVCNSFYAPGEKIELPRIKQFKTNLCKDDTHKANN